MTPDQKEAAEIAERGYRLAVRDGKTHVTLTRERLRTVLDALAASQPTPSAHPDDEAVDRFAAAMKAKLAKKRAEGRGGWADKDDCSNALLSRLLREHIDKGDPIDVGNLAMMLHQRGERIAPAADTGQTIAWITEANAKKLAQSKKPLQLWVFPHDPSQISGTPYVALAASQPAPAANTDDETYEIGKRDGYEKAVQDIDLLTGGDGEYRFCTNEDPDRHTPTPEAMIQRIVDRFGALTATDTGQAVAWMYDKDGVIFINRNSHPWEADTGWKITPLGPLTHPAPLDAERVRELEEALRPFAECAAQIDPEEDDEEWAKFRLLIKDYRVARAALRQKEGKA